MFKSKGPDISPEELAYPEQDFPDLLMVDPTKPQQLLFMAENQGLYTDDATVVDAFKKIDQDYLESPLAVVRRIDAMFVDASRRLLLHEGVKRPLTADYAHMSSDADAESDELLLLTSPLNDGRPTSAPATMLRYLDTPEPSSLLVAKARPNSWNPVTKLSIGHQLAEASGRPMAMAQIWSPLSLKGMSEADITKLKKGDYSPYGKIGAGIIDEINVERQELGKTPITKVHLFGAGIAQRAAGVAAYLARDRQDLTVETAHLFNLSLKRGLRVAADHVTQRGADEASRLKVPEGFAHIPEPAMRQAIERRTDTAQMMLRQLNAMRHYSTTIKPFQSAYQPTLEDIDVLLQNDTLVRVTNGMNVAMAINTLQLLPVGHPNLELSTVVANPGNKVTMMANEHAALVALAMNMGPADAQKRLAQ